MQSYGDESEDFHILLKAYRGMRPADFKRFLTFFIEAGRQPDATDKDGRTLWDIAETPRTKMAEPCGTSPKSIAKVRILLKSEPRLDKDTQRQSGLTQDWPVFIQA